MSMAGYMDERSTEQNLASQQTARDADARTWLNQAASPEIRLIKFDTWLRIELDARLDWKWAADLKQKRLEQCRIQIDGMILHLWRRGWMLDGQRLANRITEMLDAIGKAQRAGQVRDFWPYFKTSVSRYVGLNSEEIQAESMSAGSSISQVFQQLTKRLPANQSLPELVAQRADETIRAKITRQRQSEARKSAGKDQLHFL